MSKVELADLRQLAISTAEMNASGQQSKGRPRIRQRLGAAVSTIATHFPPTRNETLSNIVPPSVGIAVGATTALLSPDPVALKGGVFYGSLSCVVLWGLAKTLFKESPNDTYNRLVKKKKPGEIFRFRRRSGRVRDAWRTGESSVQTVLYVVPQEPPTEYYVVPSEDIAILKKKASL